MAQLFIQKKGVDIYSLGTAKDDGPVVGLLLPCTLLAPESYLKRTRHEIRKRRHLHTSTVHSIVEAVEGSNIPRDAIDVDLKVDFGKGPSKPIFQLTRIGTRIQAMGEIPRR